MGKTPAGVAKLAKAQKKKVVAFAGCFGEGIEQCMESGLFDACYSITDGFSEEERGRAMQTECAMQNMERAVEETTSRRTKPLSSLYTLQICRL